MMLVVNDSWTGSLKGATPSGARDIGGLTVHLGRVADDAVSHVGRVKPH